MYQVKVLLIVNEIENYINMLQHAALFTRTDRNRLCWGYDGDE